MSDSEHYYTVKRGDTLSKIARKMYGDASLYMAIFEANEDILDDPDEIEVGQELFIPEFEADEDEDEDEDDFEEEGEQDDGETYYTVQRGDTLSKIARAMYGDASLYMVIFEANEDILDDPDEIEVGQELFIPELAGDDEDEDEDEDDEDEEEGEDSEDYYTVQPGDTLSKIARRVYGDASVYMAIFEANEDVLDDPDEIEVGQELYLPDLD